MPKKLKAKWYFTFGTLLGAKGGCKRRIGRDAGLKCFLPFSAIVINSPSTMQILKSDKNSGFPFGILTILNHEHFLLSKNPVHFSFFSFFKNMFTILTSLGVQVMSTSHTVRLNLARIVWEENWTHFETLISQNMPGPQRMQQQQH